MPEQHTYMVIDMKCFYASVECAERQLNPFEACLVVADKTRGPNALCLAISPRMKALGIKNRCRLSDIPKNVKYIIAPPRMQLYIDYAADIYAIYLNYFSPDDIHVYSIDESFLDVTHYLGTYHMTPKQLAKRLMNEIADKLQIPSTAGIGTNLYLAKIALDITAKKAKDHMGYLDEDLYRQTLWDYEPLTDFWQVSTGTVNRLAKYGIHTMRGIAEYPEQYIYKAFGKNAELLIDHAWGRESCEMKDIKNYRAKTHSVSFSQILPRDYSYEEARIVMQEMVLHGSHELMKRKVITPKIWIGVGYTYSATIPTSKGSTRLISATSVNSLLQDAAMPLYDSLAQSTHCHSLLYRSNHAKFSFDALLFRFVSCLKAMNPRNQDGFCTLKISLQFRELSLQIRYSTIHIGLSGISQFHKILEISTILDDFIALARSGLIFFHSIFPFVKHF